MQRERFEYFRYTVTLFVKRRYGLTIFHLKMPLENSRIQKLKNISRKLFQDTQENRDEPGEKRTCQGVSDSSTSPKSSHSEIKTQNEHTAHSKFVLNQIDCSGMSDTGESSFQKYLPNVHQEIEGNEGCEINEYEPPNEQFTLKMRSSLSRTSSCQSRLDFSPASDDDPSLLN